MKATVTQSPVIARRVMPQSDIGRSLNRLISSRIAWFLSTNEKNYRLRGRAMRSPLPLFPN